MVREIRDGISTPVAMGDEQGGSYHPQALLKFDAVDFNRVDATTNGGITRLRGILRAVQEHGNGITTHMYPHIHSQVLGALGYTDAPIEWGMPGTGVHPMDDPLDPARRARRADGPTAGPARLRCRWSTRPGSRASTRSSTPTACSPTCSRH